MTETVLTIGGMSCSMCEAHINDVIRQRFDVKKVTSSHRKGETVIVSAEPLSEERLRAAIEETGYTLLAVQTRPAEKKGFFSRLRGQ